MCMHSQFSMHMHIPCFCVRGHVRTLFDPIGVERIPRRSRAYLLMSWIQSVWCAARLPRGIMGGNSKVWGVYPARVQCRSATMQTSSAECRGWRRACLCISLQGPGLKFVLLCCCDKLHSVKLKLQGHNRIGHNEQAMLLKFLCTYLIIQDKIFCGQKAFRPHILQNLLCSWGFCQAGL